MNNRSFGTPYEFIKQYCRACKNYIKLNNEGKYMCDADITTYVTDKLDDNYDAVCSCHNKHFSYENKIPGRRY